MDSSPNLRRIVAAFGIDGEWLEDRPFGNGHVHDTRLVRLLVDGEPVSLVLQGLNTNVFPDVAALMANMVRVSDHLAAGFAASPPTGRREVLTPLRTPDGKVVVEDPAGGSWRAAPCVMAATSHDTVTDPAQVVAAARGFGEFLRMLSNLDAQTLHTVIPDFHDLASRLSAFEEALAADVAGRAADVAAEIRFIRERRHLVEFMPRLDAAHGLPLRATHNDCKVNNVLLDDRTGEGVCVLDLDTVMPGLCVHDFGDVVRTMTCRAAEDEPDLSRVRMDMDLFDGAAKGWLSETAHVLTDAELELLPHAGPALTFMIGVRFLADYLAGDRYYKIHRAEHNLDRARVQFALVQSMEQQLPQMTTVVQHALRS